MLPRLCLAALLFACSVHAGAAQWCSTEEKSLTFETTFEQEALPGEFRRFEVRLDFDPGSLDAAMLEVTVDLTAADMGDPDMNAVLFDEAWFDIGTFERATFTSDAIRELSPGQYLATGTLELKGARRTVEVPYTWEQSGGHARMHGELSLRRTDFGVGTGEWATGDSVGLDVSLAFDVQLVATE